MMTKEEKIDWLKNEVELCDEKLKSSEYVIKRLQEYELRKEIAEKELVKILAEN